jgi:hypothetical protein
VDILIVLLFLAVISGWGIWVALRAERKDPPEKS